ncbi:MAG: M20/M25/M40 family metallo-hydrolase [Ruminococcaceae bacterium]|nr:M20/M25/M40 family metallo-hydrolase [Oscillospiraceae bacterium]
MKDTILDIFGKLKRIMTVSGFETLNAQTVKETALEYTDGFFEDAQVTVSGSVILYHRSKKENARTLLLDAHIDTIGLVVSEICGEGFIRCAPVGGIDRRILTTAEVEIYGKEKIRGLFSSVPPHLANKNGDNTLPDFADMLVDTGKKNDELKRLISVGDPAVFLGKTVKLLGDRVVSAHLDDKICCASILAACKNAAKTDIDCNVTVLLSSGEETRGGGAKMASFITEADGAIALDVNFAKEKDVPDWQSSRLGDGAMISRSAVTDRKMTDIVEKCAARCGAKHKIICEADGTGTNADTIEVANRGTPCAVLSVPIKYMHTPGEVFATGDAQSVSMILFEVMKNFDAMSKENDTLLGIRYLKGGEVQ